MKLVSNIVETKALLIVQNLKENIYFFLVETLNLSGQRKRDSGNHAAALGLGNFRDLIVYEEGVRGNIDREVDEWTSVNQLEVPQPAKFWTVLVFALSTLSTISESLQSTSIKELSLSYPICSTDKNSEIGYSCDNNNNRSVCSITIM